MAFVHDAFRHSRRRLILFLLFGLLLLGVLSYQSTHILEVYKAQVGVHKAATPQQLEAQCDLDPPSDWQKLYKWEDDLPQHDADLPYPEGKTGRYVYFKNQIQMLGWNNQLNEVLMNTYLAYKSNRTYVFQDYIWKDDYYPWANHPKKPWQPRTPLNALISGPSAGGAWEVHDPFPRSISDRFLEQVCPTADRRIINTREVKPAIYWESSGKKIFDTWHKLLSEAPERCIEIQPASRDEDGVGQTFDLWFWGLGKANDFWEEFRDSAVSKLLGTSPVVQSAVDRNEYLMRGKGKPPMGASSDPYDRMLAIHIRRGDYEAACKHFARWNSTFYSWNLLDLLPDHFVHPVGWDTDPEETLRTYITHCYPTATFILDKIRSAREAYYKAAKPGQVRFLDTVYILTNDKTEWIKGVIKALRSDGWYHIVTTEELELDSHQKDVGMAVDMDFGRKAAVFIGNGWSSFTSNIVHRRLVDGKEPISTRFF